MSECEITEALRWFSNGDNRIRCRLQVLVKTVEKIHSSSRKAPRLRSPEADKLSPRTRQSPRGSTPPKQKADASVETERVSTDVPGLKLHPLDDISHFAFDCCGVAVSETQGVLRTQHIHRQTHP